MVYMNSSVEIELDISRFANDQKFLAIAEVVARHAEGRRREYRATEAPVEKGLLAIEIYWSDSVPWYEWMTDPVLLQLCAGECSVPIEELARFIAFQIRPANWEVYFWMSIAFQGGTPINQSDSRLDGLRFLLNEEKEKQRANARKAGLASGRERAKAARCTPDEVVRKYQNLMATGTEEQNVAAILGAAYGVSAGYIRRLRRKANKKT